jgi:hypothetical protein
MNPTIVNLTLAEADTEYSVPLAGVRNFAMQCRTAAAVRFAFATGKVAGPTAPYATMKEGAPFSNPEPAVGVAFNGTLYLASSTAGVVVEIIIYT